MTLLSQLSLISWSSQQKHYLFTAMLIRIKSWRIWNEKSCEIVPDMKISCCKVWLNSANFPSKDGGSNQNAKPNKKLFNNLLMMILFGIIYGFCLIVQIYDFKRLSLSKQLCELTSKIFFYLLFFDSFLPLLQFAWKIVKWHQVNSFQIKRCQIFLWVLFLVLEKKI